MHIVVISGHAEFGFAQEGDTLRRPRATSSSPVDEKALAALALKAKEQLDAKSCQGTGTKGDGKGRSPAFNPPWVPDRPLPNPMVRRRPRSLQPGDPPGRRADSLRPERPVQPQRGRRGAGRESHLPVGIVSSARWGIGFQDFCAEIRIEKAKELLAGHRSQGQGTSRWGSAYDDADLFRSRLQAEGWHDPAGNSARRGKE